jgi:hypothetical protein
LFLFLTAASFTGSSLLESQAAIAAPLPANPGLLNPVVSPACLTPAALLCVGFCCWGTLTNYDSYEEFGLRTITFDVVVECSDGSSCTGRFDVSVAAGGGWYEISFGSNC